MVCCSAVSECAITQRHQSLEMICVYVLARDALFSRKIYMRSVYIFFLYSQPKSVSHSELAFFCMCFLLLLLWMVIADISAGNFRSACKHSRTKNQFVVQMQTYCIYSYCLSN